MLPIPPALAFSVNTYLKPTHRPGPRWTPIAGSTAVLIAGLLFSDWHSLFPAVSSFVPPDAEETQRRRHGAPAYRSMAQQEDVANVLGPLLS